MRLRRRLEKLGQRIAGAGDASGGRVSLQWALKLSDEEAERLFPGLIAQADRELEEWERQHQAAPRSEAP